MAKRKNQAKLADFRQVIQVPLLEGWVEAIETKIAKPALLVEEFLNLPTFQLKIGLGPSMQGGFSASVMNCDGTSPNGGLMFFANAPTPQGAIALCMLKLDFLEQSGDWQTVADSSTPSGYR